MGLGGVVIDAVAGAQNLPVRSDLHLELTGNNDIAFLALVAGQFNVLILRLLGIGGVYVQRLGDSVFELRGEVIVHHAVRLLYPLPHAVSGHGVAGKTGARTLDNIGNVNIQNQRPAVNKGEVQIRLACLAKSVFLNRNARLFGHALFGNALDFTKLLNASGHLLKLEFQTRRLIHE